MAKLGNRGLRVLRTIHLVAAGLWIGGAVALNLMIAGLSTAESDGQLYGFNLACKFLDDAVLIPGAMGCLVTGILISSLTNWGFWKHRWVIVKYVLTIFCILFGTFYLGPTVNDQPEISYREGLMALSNPEYVDNYYSSLKGGAVQILLLLLMFLISVFKPLKGRGRGLVPEHGPKAS
ncbi:MAG: DUF2269 family protein [Deltaproteobacteria bacterium]|jgi:hypothetical protein|nr:DUF2269 family protein [Deltaproteobacteria bacterium]